MIDFAEFYRAVHGSEKKPFYWQESLASQIVAEGWPENGVIPLPTASGKTSVIDIAVFGLAAHAERKAADRFTPLRTFFVVDRRLVVDDVTRHAQNLRKKLMTAESGVLHEIRERLRNFKSRQPLQVATLRGGMYRSHAWADEPNQPLVCVTTVDQIGSRLLFRGYGNSEERRPVDAGLIGCDSLIIIDEAHLSQPFLDTLQWVQKYSQWAEYKLPKMRVVEMSATSRVTKNVLVSEADWKNDKALKPRLDAEKRAELREVTELEDEAASEAKRLALLPQVHVVGVILNTVNAARAVFQRLDDRAGGAVLLTGRVRPFDRDMLLDRFLGRMKVGRDRTQDGRLFVVSTQTIEVGADLDFDALVTEAAPLDSLRQRFGRLDRLGELGLTNAVVLRHKQRRGNSDPVYGEATQKTWEWLTQHSQKEGSRKLIDFGARRMGELYSSRGEEALMASAARAPVLLPVHVETLAQTCPSPAPSPEIAPFLHGGGAASADVNMVWRADLDDFGDWGAIVELAPPLMTEALPVPVWVAKNWLRKEDAGMTPDLEGVAEPSEEATGTTEREFLIWRGPGKNVIGGIYQIRPGDTIIVRSTEGGADSYGWNPESTDRVTDVGDLCANERAEKAGGRYVVRLHPTLIFSDDDENQAQLRQDLKAWQRDEDEDAGDRIWRLVAERVTKPAREDWRLEPYPGSTSLRFMTRWISPERETEFEVPTEEPEEDESSLTAHISLSRHTGGVVAKLREFVSGCGLEQQLSGALLKAAELHDLGKNDERFQMMLDPFRRVQDEPLGKGNAALSPAERRRRRVLAGYPEGARHEFWSVALLEKIPGLGANGVRDLVLYLIGTHHGYGRPFAPVWEEWDSEFEVSAKVDGDEWRASIKDIQRVWSLGSGWVDRFWLLNRKYGYWGLAYLEALLRRADCVQSRQEQEGNTR